MPPVVDVNNALVAAILTGYPGFTTAAGHIGPHYRVDHDNSMLVPEVWCRMRVHEREASFLIENGYLERVNDFDFEGRKILASRLGYRITALFVDHFLGRIFEMPSAVFPEELLRPEKQDLSIFVTGVDAIVEAQRTVAMNYFEDGSVNAACPPIKALLHIMAYGEYDGMHENDASFRALFTREALLGSEWYRERLRIQQSHDVALWTRHTEALESFDRNGSGASGIDWDARLGKARAQLKRVSSGGYPAELVGTIGMDPLVGGVRQAYDAALRTFGSNFTGSNNGSKDA